MDRIFCPFFIFVGIEHPVGLALKMVLIPLIVKWHGWGGGNGESRIFGYFVMEFVGSNSGRKFSEFCVRACRV